jgi:hypothetical protein
MPQRFHAEIEPFAALLAELEHPFADRAQVLRAAGLDEEALETLKRHWLSTLGAAPAGPNPLLQRFGNAYERSRTAIGAARRNPAPDRPAPEPRSSAAAAQPEPDLAVQQVLQRMKHFTSLQETRLGSVAPAGPALPFSPSAPSSPAPAFPRPVEPSSRAPALPPSMRGFTGIDGTQPAPDDAPVRPALPFNPPARPEPLDVPPRAIEAPPRLSLEQYTCLCVELSLYPSHVPEVLRRYGVDEEDRRTLDAFWGARIRIDANLRRAWEGLHSAYCARLCGPSGPAR